MGAELQKQSGRYDPKSSRASASADGRALPLSSVSNGDRSNAVDEARRLAQGHAWMHTEAEPLFVDGMFKACQQVKYSTLRSVLHSVMPSVIFC